MDQAESGPVLLILQINLQGEAQGFPCPEEERFGGGDAGMEDFGNLFVGKFVVASQHNCESLLLWQRADGIFDGLEHLFLQGAVVGGAGGGVGQVEPGGTAGGGRFVFGRLEGDEGGAGAAAMFVKDEIADDGEHPSLELGGGAIGTGGAIDADEDLLSEVLGLDGIAEHFGDGAINGALVFFDQLAQGVVIAFGDAGHESLVVGVGIEGGVAGRVGITNVFTHLGARSGGGDVCDATNFIGCNDAGHF